MELECHEIANAFPLLNGDPFEELCDDIARKGLLHPIITLDDKILDGRNRYRACLKVGAEPWFVPYGSKVDPIDFVISTNLVRRMLTLSQKQMAAAELANMREGRPTKTPPNGGVSHAISTAQAAEKLGVSKRQVERAIAIKKADPDLAKQVKDGKISVSKAVAEIKKADGRRAANQKRAIERYEAEKAGGNQLPGQVLSPLKLSPEKTVDDKILAAINSGKGLINIVEDIKEAETLGFSDEHLWSLIQLLGTEIKNRRAVKRALEAHYQQRKM